MIVFIYIYVISAALMLIGAVASIFNSKAAEYFEIDCWLSVFVFSFLGFIPIINTYAICGLIKDKYCQELVNKITPNHFK